MDVSALLAAIANVIKENGNNEITGTVLQSVFTQLVNVLNAGKQDPLVSGVDIKTINGTSILGSGNLNAFPSLSADMESGDLTGTICSGATVEDAAALFGISADALDALIDGNYIVFDVTVDYELYTKKCVLRSVSRSWDDIHETRTIFSCPGGTLTMIRADIDYDDIYEYTITVA